RRGLHPPGRALGRPPGHLGRRGPGLAPDADRRARLLPGRLPALGAGRGHVPRPARLPGTARPRPGDAPHHPPGPGRRGPPRRLRRRPPRAPGSDRARVARPPAGGDRAPPRRAGLDGGVHDALVVLAAGSWTPSAIAAGWDRVAALTAAMDEGRRRRLARLGF